MKNYKYLFPIAICVILSSLLSASFYQKNVAAMQAEAESLLVHTLTGEVRKKVVEANLFCLYASHSDTVPLTIHVTTEQGVKLYKVDPEKSRKNISQNPRERSLHTLVCEESPLLADSLNKLWIDTLRARQIYASTAVRVSAATLYDQTVVSTSTGDSEFVTSSVCFVAYIGSGCEIEVTGLLKYSWWDVCLYRWSPFLWVGAGVVLALFLLYLFYRLTHRPAKIEVIKEKVVREVVREVPVPVCVKKPDNINLKIYQLQPGLLFDARKQVLLLNGVEKVLAPQSCVILKLFLDAPDYTLTDSEILNGLWGKKDSTIKNFTAACVRLRKSLSEVGFEVLFKRVENNQYRMIVC